MGSSVPGSSSSCSRCCTPRPNTGCFVTLPGSCVYYTGTSLSGPGINRNDTFNVVVEKLTEYIESGVETQMSITSDSNGLRLVNDELEPGTLQYYGTDDGGTKGFFDLPEGGGGFTIAQNGLNSPAADTVELGGTLINAPTTIEMNGNSIIFDDGSQNNIEIAPSSLNFYNGSIGLLASITNDPFPNTSDQLLITGNTRTSGYTLGQIKVDDLQEDYSIQVEDSGTMFVYSDDGIFNDRNFTLPAAVPGLIYHFAYSGNGVAFIRIIASGSDFISYAIPPANPTFGGSIQANNLGCTISIACAVAGQWFAIAQVGIWSVPI
jgi:hypothetical protein